MLHQYHTFTKMMQKYTKKKLLVSLGGDDGRMLFEIEFVFIQFTFSIRKHAHAHSPHSLNLILSQHQC